MKFNVDGAFCSSSDHVGLGVILMDSAGSVMDGFCGSKVASSAFMTEAYALRMTTVMAISLGLENIVLESDCSELVDCVNNRLGGPWDCKVIVDDIVNLLGSVSSVKVCHVDRSLNKVANWLAKSSLRGMCPLDWVFQPPSSLVSILAADLGFDSEGIG